MADSVSSHASLYPEFEEGIDETLDLILPTAESDQTRKWVYQYMESLISSIPGVLRVFQYGSTAGHTYLPDGDVDVGAFLLPDSQEEFFPTLVRQLTNHQMIAKQRVKNNESMNTAKPLIKDIAFISNAQVKIVKCNIGGVSVDTSANTINARATVFFLEEVNRHIARKHLFRRSILLIKAWCHYEGRIQGSDTGLLSSFAIATMVLYIFNANHAAIQNPFHVLYFFLKCYSNFNFQSECITVRGPTSLHSIYRHEANPHEPSEPLFSDQFWRTQSERFYTAPNTPSKHFESRWFNIMDPLNSNNNIGRSVSKENSHYISDQLKKGWANLQSGISSLPSGIPRVPSTNSPIRSLSQTENDTKHKEPSPEENKETKEKLDSASSDQLPTDSPPSPMSPSFSQTSLQRGAEQQTLRFQSRKSAAKSFLKGTLFPATWRKYGNHKSDGDEKHDKHCSRPDVASYMDLFGTEEPKQPRQNSLTLERPISPRRRSLPPNWQQQPGSNQNQDSFLSTFDHIPVPQHSPHHSPHHSPPHPRLDRLPREPSTITLTREPSSTSVTREPTTGTEELRFIIKQNSVEIKLDELNGDETEEDTKPFSSYVPPSTERTISGTSSGYSSTSNSSKNLLKKHKKPTAILTRTETDKSLKSIPEKKSVPSIQPPSPKEKQGRDSCFGLLGAWSRPIAKHNTKYEPSNETDTRIKGKEDENQQSSTRSLATEKDDGRRDSTASDVSGNSAPLAPPTKTLPTSVRVMLESLEHKPLQEVAKQFYLEKEELKEKNRVLSDQIEEYKRREKPTREEQKSKVGDNHLREIDAYFNKISTAGPGYGPPPQSLSFPPFGGMEPRYIYSAGMPPPSTTHSPSRKSSTIEQPSFFSSSTLTASPSQIRSSSPSSHTVSNGAPSPGKSNNKDKDGLIADISADYTSYNQEFEQFQALRQEWNAIKSTPTQPQYPTVQAISYPAQFQQPTYLIPTSTSSTPLQWIPQQPVALQVQPQQMLQFLQYQQQYQYPPSGQQQLRPPLTLPPGGDLRKTPITRSQTGISPSMATRYL